SMDSRGFFRKKRTSHRSGFAKSCDCALSQKVWGREGSSKNRKHRGELLSMGRVPGYLRTMSFINRRMGLTASSRSTVQNNPSRTSRETEKANAPLKLGRYLEKISDPCRSSDPSLDE